MKYVSIAGKTNVNLSVIRETSKVLLNKDLTTNIKGNSEALALYSLLQTNDEYSNHVNGQNLINYTFMVICERYSIINLLMIFNHCSFIVEETIQNGIFLSFINGSLHDIVTIIKNNSFINQQRDILEILNSIQELLSNEGYILLFKEYIKMKHPEFPNCFYLKEK